ncbi:60S ribosomal protein L6 [Asimina triloba]
MEAKFFRFLKIVGVGFKARAEVEGRMLYLKLGYSHEVELTVPPAVRVFCFKPNIVCCTGIDKQRVHQFAAAVRSCKPPEVYKGKGIMYIDEVIKKKQGKNQPIIFIELYLYLLAAAHSKRSSSDPAGGCVGLCHIFLIFSSCAGPCGV